MRKIVFILLNTFFIYIASASDKIGIEVIEKINDSTYAISYNEILINNLDFKIILPNENLFIEKIEIIYHNETDYTYKGKLLNEPFFFFMSKVNNTYAGYLKGNGVVYQIYSNEFTNFSFHLIKKKPAKFYCGNVGNVKNKDENNDNNYFDFKDDIGIKNETIKRYKSSSENTDCVNDLCQLRILVLYTPKLKEKRGESTILAQINNTMAELNQSFLNSGVNHTAVLAGTEKMFSSNGFDKFNGLQLPINANSALDKLTNRNDGYADYHINYTRDELQADIVVVLNHYKMSGLAGRASSIGGHRDSVPCAIATFRYIEDGYTFLHEVGHLLGLRHEYEDDGSTTPYEKGHAYKTPSNKCTIMRSGGSSSCSDILYWSTPNLAVGNELLGNSTFANATEVLNQSIPNHALGYRLIYDYHDIENLTGIVNDSYFRRIKITMKGDNMLNENSCLYLKSGYEIVLEDEVEINNYFEAIIEDPYCADGNIPNSQFEFGETGSSSELKNDKLTNSINIYPNPLSIGQALQVMVNSDMPNLTLNIYDLSGRFIERHSLNHGSNSIHIAHKLTGLYLIKLYSFNKIVSTHKILFHEK